MCVSKIAFVNISIQFVRVTSPHLFLKFWKSDFSISSILLFAFL